MKRYNLQLVCDMEVKIEYYVEKSNRFEGQDDDDDNDNHNDLDIIRTRKLSERIQNFGHREIKIYQLKNM
jgi:hypothetical protein